MKQYQIEALKTKPESAALYEDAQHAGFGLITEVGELVDTYKRNRFYKKDLDVKNLIEESGDVLWYIAIGYHSLQLDMPDVPPLPTFINPALGQLTLDKLLAKLAHHAANFFSITLMYPESWQEEQLDYDLNRLYYYMSLFTKQELGVDIEDAAVANIEKLAKRYPGKVFSIEKALTRDTENELSHIEIKEKIDESGERTSNDTESVEDRADS